MNIQKHIWPQGVGSWLQLLANDRYSMSTDSLAHLNCLLLPLEINLVYASLQTLNGNKSYHFALQHVGAGVCLLGLH